jgi:deoxyinosine 3'endonuclease (endonuclease V)
MSLFDLHNWEHEQLRLSKLVDTKSTLLLSQIQYVGGFDISFDPVDNTRICAYLTVMKISTLDVVYDDYLIDQIQVPYISGYLGFREVPYYQRLHQRLMQTHPELCPQIYLVDGCGILHPRNCGSASHLGVLINIPTIGVSKTLLAIDGLCESAIKVQFRQCCRQAGDSIKLIGHSGQVYGYAYKSTAKTTNPIFISVGHGLNLSSVYPIIKACIRYRIPEPIRYSDINSKLHFNQSK